MTRMTGPDCAVMCNLINTHTHTHTHTRRFFFVLQQALSFRTRHHLCRQGMALARSLPTESGACEHPTPPFPRPGVYTRVTGVGGGKRDVTDPGDETGAGAGTGVEANE